MGKMALLRAADKRAFNYVEELYEPSHLLEIVLNKLKPSTDVTSCVAACPRL